jgi:hypothetical protein
METKKKKNASKNILTKVDGEIIQTWTLTEDQLYEALDFDNFLTSSLSRYGVGVKYALGYLGKIFSGISINSLPNILASSRSAKSAVTQNVSWNLVVY